MGRLALLFVALLATDLHARCTAGAGDRVRGTIRESVVERDDGDADEVTELIADCGTVRRVRGGKRLGSGRRVDATIVDRDTATDAVPLVPDSAADAFVATADVAAPTMTRRVYAVAVQFDGIPAPTDAITLMQNELSDIPGWYAEDSRGRLAMTLDVHPVVVSLGPLDCSLANVSAKVVAALPDVPWGTYTNLLTAGPFIGRCGWAGIAGIGSWTIGGYSLGVSLNVLTDALGHVGTHELGHNLGSYHSPFLECPTGGELPLGHPLTCTRVEYGNPYSVMGRSGPMGHHDGLQKLAMGFLDASEVADVTEPGIHQLCALETTDNPGCPRLLRYRRTPYDWLAIDLRARVGADANHPGDFDQGVLIHSVDASLAPAFSKVNLLDASPAGGVDPYVSALLPGTSFDDLATGGSVTLLARDGDVATVYVEPGTPEAGVPSVSLLEPIRGDGANVPVYSGQVRVRASATPPVWLLRVQQFERTTTQESTTGEVDEVVDSARWWADGSHYVFSTAVSPAGTVATDPDQWRFRILVQNPDTGPPTFCDIAGLPLTGSPGSLVGLTPLCEDDRPPCLRWELYIDDTLRGLGDQFVASGYYGLHAGANVFRLACYDMSNGRTDSREYIVTGQAATTTTANTTSTASTSTTTQTTTSTTRSSTTSTSTVTSTTGTTTTTLCTPPRARRCRLLNRLQMRAARLEKKKLQGSRR